jgi:hypothetical protein
MEDALSFFKAYEIWIYLLLGLVGLYFARKFILSWQELRSASFGLERESAQVKLNLAASILVLIFMMILVEFALVSFVAPALPETSPLITPTINLLTTPTITLVAETQTITSTLASGLPTLTPTVLTSTESGCLAGQIMLDFPSEGTQIQGLIEIRGTVNTPNFGFYKLEMKRPDEQNWLTIFAGDQIHNSEVLGSWNTSLMTAGEYQLALVVVDNQGQSSPPCIVKVYLTNPEGTPQSGGG